MEESVDLALPERSHSGGRYRRGGTPPVPLSRCLAAGTRRGEVRPGAGTVDSVAGMAGRHNKRPVTPGPDPQAGVGAGAAATRPRLLPCRRRAIWRGKRNLWAGNTFVRARPGPAGPRRAPACLGRARLPRQEWSAPDRTNPGPRGGACGALADAPSEPHRAIAGVSQLIRVDRRPRR